jgi:hypothetical protein
MRRLQATFATDRLENIKSWCADNVARTGAPLVLRFCQTTAADGTTLAAVHGPAHHVMRVVGIVADQGEDFLLSVLP